MSKTLYEPFELEKHNKEFINYCEVIVDRNGKVYYATPSHQMFMLALYGVETNQLPKEYIDPSRPDLRQYSNMFNVDILLESTLDIEETIRKEIGCISVYFADFIGEPNDIQKEVLKQLHDSDACNFDRYEGYEMK